MYPFPFYFIQKLRMQKNMAYKNVFEDTYDSRSFIILL